MNNKINHFSGAHYVLLTLERGIEDENNSSFSNDVINHFRYYQQLRESLKVVSYGEVMNQPAVCIILSVSSDNDFEQIILNDPALKSSAYKIKNVMPFVNNGAITITEPDSYFRSELEMEYAID
jgi:hypothetical protein